MRELGINRESTLQTKKELVPMDRKLRGWGKHERRSCKKRGRAHPELHRIGDTEGRYGRRKASENALLGDTKVEYHSERSNRLHPCLSSGGDNRKSGVKDRVETKTPLKKGGKSETDSGSITAGKKTLETTKRRKIQKTGRNSRDGAKILGMLYRLQ